MTNRPTSALILLLILILSACGSPMKTPDIKQNPHPTKRYEVTMTIDGAPGPFDSIEASAQYQVMNPRSVPAQPFSGATPTIGKHISIALTRVDEHIYRGAFYTDLMQDEDYFGMGVCHWELIAVSAELKAAPAIFTPDIWSADILAAKSRTTYFANQLYRNPQLQGGDSGTVMTEYVTQHRSEFFSVTFAIKEDFQ